MALYGVVIQIITLLSIWKVSVGQIIEEGIFSPNIEHSCKGGYMTVKVNTNIPYHGILYTKDHRKDPCIAKGGGSRTTVLTLPLVTDSNDPSYCGVKINKLKQKYVILFVRSHKALELADDKTYKIGCGLQGFTTSRNETNLIDFDLYDAHRKKPSSTAVFDRKYVLRGKIIGPDKQHVLRVLECFAFGEGNTSKTLTDDQGCPIDNSISQFIYDDDSGTANATIYKMFKFQESPRVNFQCDVSICRAPCEMPKCASRPERLVESKTQEGRALPGNSPNNIEGDSPRVQAGTGVFVVPPGSDEIEVECEYYPPWLWILCIALAVLFIIMMIINIFLCSAMTCSCTKTEVIEKEPSIIEDYDPYRSWHGSQYGSRYSLNGKGYTSGASTMNSARSVSSHSDHYAIVHSRPDSRYSGHQSMKDQRYYKSPPSTTGSQYSNRI